MKGNESGKIIGYKPLLADSDVTTDEFKEKIFTMNFDENSQIPKNSLNNLKRNANMKSSSNQRIGSNASKTLFIH